MLKRLFNRYPLGSFYFISLFFVIAVMVAFVVLMTIDPTVSQVLPGIWAFVVERGSYINLWEIVLYSIEHHPAAWLIIIFAIAPTVAAILCSLGKSGIAGLKSLLSRFKPWRGNVDARKGLKVYGLFLLCYLIGSVAFLWMNQNIAGPFAFEKVYNILGGTSLAALGTLLLGLLLDEGGTLEELGWRGYALPLLLDRMRSPLRATMVVAVLWWAWHLPREITTLMGPVELTTFLWHQFIFLVLCAALSVLITFMFVHTGGSVWAGILIHGGTNVWSKAMGGPLFGALGFDLRTVIVVLAALLVIFLTRGRLGVSQ